MTGVLSMGGGAWGAMTAPLDQSTLSQPGGGEGQIMPAEYTQSPLIKNGDKCPTLGVS